MAGLGDLLDPEKVRTALKSVFDENYRPKPAYFAAIEAWTVTKTKFEAMTLLNEHDIPCGPILSMKELAAEPSLRETGTIVEVDHPKRGKYLTVGNPIKLSDSATVVTRSPLLGEHTDEVLEELGFNREEIAGFRSSKVI